MHAQGMVIAFPMSISTGSKWKGWTYGALAGMMEPVGALVVGVRSRPGGGCAQARARPGLTGGAVVVVACARLAGAPGGRPEGARGWEGPEGARWREGPEGARWGERA